MLGAWALSGLKGWDSGGKWFELKKQELESIFSNLPPPLLFSLKGISLAFLNHFSPCSPDVSEMEVEAARGGLL